MKVLKKEKSRKCTASEALSDKFREQILKILREKEKKKWKKKEQKTSLQKSQKSSVIHND